MANIKDLTNEELLEIIGAEHQAIIAPVRSREITESTRPTVPDQTGAIQAPDEQPIDLSQFSEEELRRILEPSPIESVGLERGERSLIGNIFERPAAAVRAGVMGLAPGGETPLEAFTRGSIVPEEVPTFQEEALRATGERVADVAARRTGILAPNRPIGRIATTLESLQFGAPASAAGFLADIATNPAELLALFVPKIPVGGGRQLAQVIGETNVAKALGRFATKQRRLIKTPIRKNVSKEVRLVNSVRDSAFNAKRQAGENFEESLNALSKANPEQRASVRAATEILKEEATQPGVASSLKSAQRKSATGTLKRVLEDPDFADNMTLRQLQDLKADIKKAPTLKAKLKQGKLAQFQDTDFPLLDFIDEIRSSQLSVFPEMANTNAQYRQTLNQYTLIKNKIKEGKLFSNIKTNFSDEPEVLNAIQQLLDPKVLDKIGGFQNFLKISETAGWLKKLLIGGAASGAALALGFKTVGGSQE